METQMRHVAQFYGLAWTTVKRIDKRHLERELGPVDLEDVRVIALDEFAIHKGHRYAIMAANLLSSPRTIEMSVRKLPHQVDS